MTDQQVKAAPEKPSRYDRSFGGLLVAMVVTVALVGAFVGVRALLRTQPDGQPTPVDYLQPVRDLQGVKVTVAYPSDLPVGWTPTSVDYQRGTNPLWSIGIVTRAGTFVGVVQQGVPLGQLLDTYVDQHYRHDPDTRVESVFGDTWDTWSDSGGDHALSIDPTSGPLAGQHVLVYGSASLADQEELVQLLTTDDLPPRTSSSPEVGDS